MLFDKTAKTGLAFVSLKEGGVPDFMFYRNPSADMLLESLRAGQTVYVEYPRFPLRLDLSDL